jgi:hypothetical protein
MATTRFVHLRHRRVALAALTGALGALSGSDTAAAQTPAPTLQTDRTCYGTGSPVEVSGAGFTPGGAASFNLTVDGTNADRRVLLGSLVAGSTGEVSGAFRAPRLASGDELRQQVTLTGTDQTAGPTRPPAVTQFTVSYFGVGVDDPGWRSRPRLADPRRRTRFQLVGFVPARVAWAHYRYGGRTVKSVRLGAFQGPCGDLLKTMRQFPFSPVRAGQWTIMFSGESRFDPNSTYLRVSVRVPRAKAVD